MEHTRLQPKIRHIGKQSKTVLFYTLFIICKGFIYFSCAFQNISLRRFPYDFTFSQWPKGKTPSPHNGQLPLKNTKIKSRWPLTPQLLRFIQKWSITTAVRLPPPTPYTVAFIKILCSNEYTIFFISSLGFSKYAVSTHPSPSSHISIESSPFRVSHRDQISRRHS